MALSQALDVTTSGVQRLRRIVYPWRLEGNHENAAGARNVHFEGELVLVIGRKCKNVSAAEAREAIFGVTCGNDVSERDWQGSAQKDLQWWRAKGADTFAPLGPIIVRGLDYTKS